MNRRPLMFGAAVAFFAVAATLGSGCSTSDTSFHVENGICYRTRVEKTAGIQTSKRTVQAVPENCAALVEAP